MDKYTVKPSAHEISVNSGSIEGAVDVFSYGSDTGDLRDLGRLFVVGHTEETGDTVSYMVSLIAALAKREYFGHGVGEPKERFTRAVRKINEVVEEFFKNSSIGISVGVVAVATGKLYVSKLDKFRVLLARDGEVIDVLNDVAHFEKEHVEKKEFSSVISGPVHAGDRILAYCPTKNVVPRERSIKKSLVDLDRSSFSNYVEQLGREHAVFGCAMVYVDMLQVRELATIPSIQPKELSGATLAEASTDTAWEPEAPEVAPKSENLKPMVAASPAVAEPVEVPRIIASEFWLGTRSNRFTAALSHIRFVRLDARGKAIIFSVIATLLIGGTLLSRSLLITSPEELQRQTVLNTATGDLSTARQKIAQNDIVAARQLLLASLRNVQTLPGNNDAIRNLSAQLIAQLDDLDKAQTVTPSPVTRLPAQYRDPAHVAASSNGSSVFVVTHKGDVPVLVRLEGDASTELDYDANSASALSASGEAVVAIDGLDVHVIGPNEHHNLKVATPARSLSIYEGNAYILTQAGVAKVADVSGSSPAVTSWLSQSEQLPAQALHIAVDGDVFILAADGSLSQYYKGKKIASLQTTIPVSEQGRLLTRSEEQVLYYADFTNRRIYLIDKASGAIVKALKPDLPGGFIDASLGPAGTLILLDSTGKLWSVH